MNVYGVGSRVWLPDRDEVWIPGQVAAALSGQQDLTLTIVPQASAGQGTPLVVCVRNNEDLPPLMNPDLLLGANDLTTLSYLHEPAVLYNLGVRFRDLRCIYTYCGIVLVAVNPYTPLPIYGKEFAAAYSNYHLGELDPHIYAVAEAAYRAMTRGGESQSIVVSGESGAGKTVTAKYAMRYFASVGGGANGQGCVTHVEEMVLASNPIMEAIGNAKTVRNDNSSRFGKYLDISFSASHAISGGHMKTYLLESTRCVQQAPGERNYHIFYQLCAASSEEGWGHWALGPASQYHYTRQGCPQSPPSGDDLTQFRTTQDALRMLHFPDNKLNQFYQALAAILNLGNVGVGVAHRDGEEVGSIPPGDMWLERTAELLKVDGTALHKWLTHRKIATAQETIIKPLSQRQTIGARDSLAKHLYTHLFDWVVSWINHTLSPDTECHASIGVLDIYGFEVFQENSFEQFCINYANEKLQQQFNLHVFKLEQQEYVKEAIEWSFINYCDNQPCIDLIEGRLGVCDLLDETCKLPRGDDAVLLRKLCDVHLHKGGVLHFSKPRLSPTAFNIHHYAGVVMYHSVGFVEKNRDAIMLEHMALLRTSQLRLVSELFESPVSGSKGSKRQSVGSQFRRSLHELMAGLNSTTPHYIRCIKPNDGKLPFKYDCQRVVEQLRACGVLETVRISAAGYPSRWGYKDFYQRYHALLPRGAFRKGEEVAMVMSILRSSIKSETLYRFGRTKVFFRAGQIAHLEGLRQSRQHSSGVLLQKNVRAWLARKRYLRLRKTAVWLQKLARGYLARRLANHLRREKAAIQVQRHIRGYLQRGRYSRLRLAAVAVQCFARRRAARKAYVHMLRNSKASCIQCHVRGWLVRCRYRRTLRHVIKAQCCVRRWLAKRQLGRLKVEARSVSNLRRLNKGMENKIMELQLKLTQQQVFAGLVDYEAIPGMSNSNKPVSSRAASHALQSAVTVTDVMKQLSNIAECFTRNHLDPVLSRQIFRQIFYIINAYMFNSVLLRRDLCCWTKGVQIRFNLSQLEDWCRCHGVAAVGVVSQLAPILQVSKLLQMRKSSPADVAAICELCTQLNALQVQKVLTMYCPSDEYEDRVPNTLIRLVAERGGANEVDPNLIMIDHTRCYPLELPHTNSDVQFSSLTIDKKLQLSFLRKI